jgi:hypothetical protein
MAAKATAPRTRPGASVTVLHGIGFNAYLVQGPWWVIKTTAAHPRATIAIVSGMIHRDCIRAELAAYSDACMRLMLAEGAWEQKARAA